MASAFKHDCALTLLSLLDRSATFAEPEDGMPVGGNAGSRGRHSSGLYEDLFAGCDSGTPKTSGPSRSKLQSVAKVVRTVSAYFFLLAIIGAAGIAAFALVQGTWMVTPVLSGSTAQANLQTALTGANAYWTQEGQTYAGIDGTGNPAVSNISDIDTGVNYVSGTNSSGLNVVSLWTDGSTSLVLSAWAPGTHDCWSILDLKAPATIWGQSLGMGTYYALDANVAATDCVADGTTAPTAGTLTGPQQGGFPSA
jgi:hypothetical protein